MPCLRVSVEEGQPLQAPVIYEMRGGSVAYLNFHKASRLIKRLEEEVSSIGMDTRKNTTRE